MSQILEYPMGYRGLVLNDHWSAAGAYEPAAERDTIRVSQFDFSALSVRDQIEGLHLDTGADLGVATREWRRLSLRGEILGSTPAKLEDRIARTFSAFDVEEAIRTSPATEGVSAFDFYCPTEEAGFGPIAHELFMARPRGFPVVFERLSKGLSVLYAVELVAPDPRRYVYAPTVVTFSAAAGWSKSMPNWPVGLGSLVFPVVVINCLGVGTAPANLTISDGTTSLVLDITRTSPDTTPVGFEAFGDGPLTVDMGTASMLFQSSEPSYLPGPTPVAFMRTSDVDTFYGVPPGGSTWTITNTGTVSSIVATYRMARA